VTNNLQQNVTNTKVYENVLLVYKLHDPLALLQDEGPFYSLWKW